MSTLGQADVHDIDLRTLTEAAVQLRTTTIDDVMFSALSHLRQSTTAAGAYAVARPMFDSSPMWVGRAAGSGRSPRVVSLYAGHQPSADQGGIGESLIEVTSTYDGTPRRPSTYQVGDAAVPASLARGMKASRAHSVTLIDGSIDGIGVAMVALFHTELPRAVPTLTAEVIAEGETLARLALMHGTSAAQASRLELYKALAAVSGAPVFLADREGHIVAVSEEWTATTNCAAEACIGRKMSDFLDPESRNDVDGWIDSAPVGRQMSVGAALAGTDHRTIRHTMVAQRIGWSDNTTLWVGALRPETHPMDREVAARYSVLLTDREVEIVEELLRGKRVNSIASSLFLSEHTVRNHLKHIFRKLGVSSQAELVEVTSNG